MVGNVGPATAPSAAGPGTTLPGALVPPMPQGTFNLKSPSGKGSATATTPSKSSTSTFDGPPRPLPPGHSSRTRWAWLIMYPSWRRISVRHEEGSAECPRHDTRFADRVSSKAILRGG